MTEKMFRATVDGKNDVLVIETFVAGMRCYYRPGKSPKKHFYESEVSDLTPMHLVKTDAVVVEGVNDLEVIRDQGGLFLCPAHINIICREHGGYLLANQKSAIEKAVEGLRQNSHIHHGSYVQGHNHAIDKAIAAIEGVKP